MLAAGLLAAIALPTHATASVSVSLQMSNFRFCPDQPGRPIPCDPADIAYVADQSTAAPLAPVYNPVVTIKVRPGDAVVWTYRHDAAVLLRH